MANTFFGELLKRKVFRGIGLYVFIAWLIMQAAEIVLPAFDLPNWTLRFVIIALVLGLPVVAVLSWLFDLTREGLKRDTGTPQDGHTGTLARGVDIGIIAVLTVLAGYFGWHYFFGVPPLPEGTTREPSIAVLPFVNMSSDSANEYFSDGISEELLNALARVEGLKVAGRTSSFFYKGRDQDLRQIGSDLGVATVLEGSVRKSADRIRVTAQLIDTRDGFHIWSDTFDYRLDDVFEIQDRIAEAVVVALKGKLLGEQFAADTSVITTNALCYTSYLKGRDELHRRREASIVRAETLFRQALEADPGYAPAWVGLAESYLLQHINHQLIPLDEAVSKADEAIQRALSISPESAEAYAALGLMRMQAKEYDQAEAALRRSLAINANYPEALHWYGLLNQWQGDLPRARELLTRAVELDPLHPVARMNLGKLILTQGDIDEARAFFLRSVELDDSYPANYAMLAGISVLGPMSNPAEAARYIDKALGMSAGDKDLLRYKLSIQIEMDDIEAARQTYAEMREVAPGHADTLMAGFQIAVYGQGDQQAAESLIRGLAASSEVDDKTRKVYTGIAHLVAGEYEAALDAFEAVDPSLKTIEPEISYGNLGLAKLQAISHYFLGHEERLQALLDAIDSYLEKSSRFGPDGYGLTDVEVALLRNQPEQAVERMQQAFDAGFRNRTVEGIWRLRDYPVFETLRSRPDFEALVQQIESYHQSLRAETA